MSLVGPRPHALKAKADGKLYADVVDGYFATPPGEAGRHRMGADQWLAGRDRHRGEDPKRVEHDLYYIDNWSVPSIFTSC